MSAAVNVGDVWRRRCELSAPEDVPYNTIRIVGEIFNGEEAQPEYSVAPAAEFGPVLRTTEAGITEHCTLIESSEPAPWTTPDEEL